MLAPLFRSLPANPRRAEASCRRVAAVILVVTIAFVLPPTMRVQAASLSAPILFSPSNVTLSTTMPTFQWGAVLGAARYGVYVRDVTTNTLVVDYEQIPGTATSWTLGSPYAPFVPGHTYAWNASAFDSNGNAGPITQPPLTFGVATPQLSAPVLMSPSNVTLSTTMPTFQWGAVLGAARYGVYVRDVTTNTLVVDYEQIPGTATSWTLGSPYAPLVPGHTYAWNASAFDSNGNAGPITQPPLTFGVAAPQLSAPVLMSPSNVTLSTTTPTFQWGAVLGAARYGVYVRDQTTNTIVIDYEQIPGTATSWTLGSPYAPLVPGHTYAWNANAFDSSGNAGPITQPPLPFAVAAPQLSAPVLMSPSNVTLSTTMPTFQWGAVLGAARYGVYVRDETTGVVVISYEQVSAAGSGTVSWTLGSSWTPLTPGHTYSWNARAFDSNGNAGPLTQPPLPFAVAAPQLAAPALISPSNVTLSTTTPTFQWGTVPGAARYGVYVKDETTGVVVVSYEQVSTTGSGTVSWTLGSPWALLTPGHTYSWNARAFDNIGNASPVAQPLPFGVAAPQLAAPALISPSNVTLSTTAPTFQWGAVLGAARYGVYVKDETTGVVVVSYEQVSAAGSGTVSWTLGSPWALLAPGHTYSWNARAFDNIGNASPVAQPLPFGVAAPQLSAPVLMSPSNVALSTTTPTFQWGAVLGAACYGVYVRDETTNTIVLDYEQITGTATSWTLGSPYAPLVPGHTYAWNANAFDSSGNAGPMAQPLPFGVAAPKLEAPALVGLNVSTSTLQAGSLQKAEVTVFVHDRSGNPVGRAPVTVIVDNTALVQLTVTNGTTDDEGKFVTEIIPSPAPEANGVVQVMAVSGDVHSTPSSVSLEVKPDSAAPSEKQIATALSWARSMLGREYKEDQGYYGKCFTFVADAYGGPNVMAEHFGSALMASQRLTLHEGKPEPGAWVFYSFSTVDEKGEPIVEGHVALYIGQDEGVGQDEVIDAFTYTKSGYARVEEENYLHLRDHLTTNQRTYLGWAWPDLKPGSADGEPSSAEPTATQFKDTDSVSWAQPAITSLAEAGVVGGVAPGVFAPSRNITRAELVKMLVIARGLTPGAGLPPFSDVGVQEWYAPYVITAVSAGMITGVNPQLFSPSALVTRQELAVLIARAYGLASDTSLHFSDQDEIADWATDAISALADAGIMSGFPDGSFRPTMLVTRAEVAVALARAMSQAQR